MEDIRKLIGERWTVMKRWFLSKVITPERARKMIACALSWLIYHCIMRGAWDVMTAMSVWLRKIADFIDSWNSAELPAEKDRLIADLVADAVTDELVDRLVDTVAALRVDAPSVVCPAECVGGCADAPVQ